MLYAIMRLLVNTVAVWLTVWILPGLVTNPALAYEPSELVFAFIVMGFLVWFCNWLLWPVILFFTGRMVLNIYPPFFVAVNAYLFYISTLGMPITSGGANEEIPFIVATSPLWLWVALGGLLMSLLLFVLEGLTGLDSPVRFHGPLRKIYWRLLNKLSIGERAPFVENMRIARTVNIISRYFRDIAFDATPFSPIRRFCQRMIYRKHDQPVIDDSAAATIRLMLQEFGPTFVKLGQIISSRAALDAAGCDRAALAVTFMRAMIKQVLFDGFFHGDPHPGNVMVDTDTCRIIFLDMGMMGNLTTSKRLALGDLIWSLAEQDTRELGKTVLRLVDGGLSNNEIADKLIVSFGTVKKHLNNIFGKLGVNSRTQALAGARLKPLLARFASSSQVIFAWERQRPCWLLPGLPKMPPGMAAFPGVPVLLNLFATTNQPPHIS